MGETYAIQAEDLTRSYDTHVAVQNVSFRVAFGEVYGLLGPNGAGKTTLLRMLSGILTPTEGRAIIAGFDTRSHPLEVRQRIGFISGDTALYERLSVREMLVYFARLHDLPRHACTERVEAVSQSFGLDAFLDARCGHLSTGQKQRANLARAFIAEAEILILDEPTAALDVISGQFVHQAVRQAKDQQKAVLLSTHDMAEAHALCDRLGLLVRGQLAVEGTHDQILERFGARSLSDVLIQLHRA
jgi:sodium transport system ATP-binding protein